MPAGGLLTTAPADGEAPYGVVCTWIVGGPGQKTTLNVTGASFLLQAAHGVLGEVTVA